MCSDAVAGQQPKHIGGGWATQERLAWDDVPTRTVAGSDGIFVMHDGQGGIAGVRVDLFGFALGEECSVLHVRPRWLCVR